jgi:hypothetical protein
MAIIISEQLENGNTLHTMQMWWMPITQNSLTLITEAFGGADVDNPSPIWECLFSTSVEFEQQADLEEAEQDPERFSRELYSVMAETLGRQVVLESVEALRAEADVDAAEQDAES